MNHCLMFFCGIREIAGKIGIGFMPLVGKLCSQF